MPERVLWVSRHPPLPKQIEALESKLGEIDIIQLKGVIPNAEYVINEANRYGAKYIVPVLPLSFIARLCDLARKNSITVLWSQMKLLHNNCPGEGCPEFNDKTDTIVSPGRHYRFEKFYVIKGVKLELEEWI